MASPPSFFLGEFRKRTEKSKKILLASSKFSVDTRVCRDSIYLKASVSLAIECSADESLSSSFNSASLKEAVLYLYKLAQQAPTCETMLKIQRRQLRSRKAAS